MSSSEEELPSNYHSSKRRSSSVERSDHMYRRKKSERKHEYKHHRPHHRHSHSDDYRRRHRHHKKTHHRHHDRRHHRESRHTERSKSKSQSRSRSLSGSPEEKSTEVRGPFYQVGELRPNDIPEDLDFSDAGSDSFPLSKETSLFVDAVFPDARVQVEGKGRGGRSADGDCMTNCAYTALEDGGDVVARKDKIVIELKRSTAIKTKRQSADRSNAGRSNAGEAAGRDDTGLGTWIVTSKRDKSDAGHRERHSSSSQTKRSSRDGHSSARKRKRSRSQSHERHKGSASIIRAGGKTVDEYTKMCQDIASGTDNLFNVNEPVRNPYSVMDAPDMSEIMKQIRHRVGVELGITSTLDEVFPVSCGYDHRAHEGIDLTKTGITSSVPAELGHLVISRFQAEMRLMGNPNNMEARQILWQVEQKVVQFGFFLHITASESLLCS